LDLLIARVVASTMDLVDRARHGIDVASTMNLPIARVMASTMHRFLAIA